MRRMIVGMVRDTTAVVVLVALAAACGTTAPSPSEREWTANARGVVEQLRGDVIAVSGFDRADVARAGLHDESQLYALLVAYTDFGGCRHIVAAVGVQPVGLARAVELLRRACVRLQRADRLFTRAVARTSPLLLIAATREAVAAVPSLDAAALELRRRGATGT
jgi:hypothetical protein